MTTFHCFCRSAVMVVTALLFTGCATTNLSTSSVTAPKFVRATANNPAVKCLCVWQTAEGFDPEGKPCRGVAGQVFFFNRDGAIPVLVDGDVRLFVFDDQGSEESQSKPLSQFDIDRETWNTQVTKTQFGPAYRLFVPYVRQGRHQAQMVVRLRMTPDGGPVVFSELATIDLAGHKPEKLSDLEKSPTTARVEEVLQKQLTRSPVTESRGQSATDDMPLDTNGRSQPRKTSPYTIATIRTDRSEAD